MNFSQKNVSRIGVLLILVMVFTIISLPDQTYAAAKKKKVKSITFTNATNTVKVIKKGKKVKLKVKVSPAKASKKMRFTTSNKKIATVSKKGTIKAKKKGSCYITAYAKDGSKKKKRIKVIVGSPTTKITVTGSDNIIMNGNSLQLKVTTSPKKPSYKTLTWKSSNTKVATVSSKGKVKYKKDGNCTITAYAKDGSGIKGKFKVTTATIKKNEAKFIAHRGFSSMAPENSQKAFALAGSNGFDGTECDVWQVDRDIKVITPSEGDEDETTSEPSIETVDDFVVFHDYNLQDLTGIDKNINEMKFDQLIDTTLVGGNNVNKYQGYKIPSFEQYLDWMMIAPYNNARPIIEIKSNSKAPFTKEGTDKILDMLEERDLVDKVTIIAFSDKVLENIEQSRIEDNLPDIHMMLLTNDTGTTLDKQIDWAKDKGIDGLSLHKNSLTADVSKKIHENDMEVGVFTLTSQRQAYTYIREMDADWVTSDYKLWR